MSNTPGKRWGRLSDVHDLSILEAMDTLLGEPECESTPNDGAIEYTPGVFQVWMRPDGVWIHATLLRSWQKRQFYKSIGF